MNALYHLVCHEHTHVLKGNQMDRWERQNLIKMCFSMPWNLRNTTGLTQLFLNTILVYL